MVRDWSVSFVSRCVSGGHLTVPGRVGDVYFSLFRAFSCAYILNECSAMPRRPEPW